MISINAFEGSCLYPVCTRVLLPAVLLCIRRHAGALSAGDRDTRWMGSEQDLVGRMVLARIT
jgi:hypothetical protein